MKNTIPSDALTYHDAAMDAMGAFLMAKRDRKMVIARKAIDVAEYLESVALAKVKADGFCERTEDIIGKSLAAIRDTKRKEKSKWKSHRTS